MPSVLQENEEDWTAAYVAAVTAKSKNKPEKWRDPQIKDALSEETAGKCAYCESTIADVSYPHVEHMVPKSIRPDLAHRWSNMTWACQVCNTEKGDFYDAVQGILSPYDDDMAEHLHFAGGILSFQLGAVRGEITVRVLKLNRIDLVRERCDRLTKVRDMLERWNVAIGVQREVLADAIRIDAAEGEFTSSVDAYLRSFGFPVEAGQGMKEGVSGVG
ncbi:HNH endonuclease [Nocardia ignorata]|nr:HNH endonuclease [Nocardia ignorata]